MRNCVDIVRPFTEALDGREDVQLIGGIGSAALNHPDTVIVPEEKRIIAPADLQLSQYRPDGNLRDFDVLVLSPDRQKVETVEQLANQTIGSELELSVFDVKPIEQMLAMPGHPAKSLLQFVSDRYVYENPGLDLRVARRALFPFWVNIDNETLETWQLEIGEGDRHPAPVPHPGSVILNYLTRSVSGLRAKDAQKVGTMADAIINKAPQTLDWMIDGPGQSQMEMARILQRLSRPGKLAVGQLLAVTPVKGSLGNHPAFMLPDATPLTKQAILDITQAKSRAVRWFEEQDRVVTFWQKHIEGRIDRLVHND